MFEVSISPVLLILFCILIVSSLYLMLGFRHYVVAVRRRMITDTGREMTGNQDESSLPPVSVVVYSCDDAENLQSLLPQILGQQYPAPFEVIVVNDGDIVATKDVIARLEQQYSNLYMTFTPVDSRALSRKKLAVTLGIKAAKYGVVVLTTGECQVPSTRWLTSLARHFSENSATDMVIGYAVPSAPEEISHRWKRLHAFDHVRTSVEWLSWAIAGRPYRATGCNLAYKRDLFFRNKGFSKSLNLKWGDDDIFVSEVANKYNTTVELSTDSIVLQTSDTPGVAHRSAKIRRNFTASRLRGHARLFFSSCSWAWWIMIASAVGLSILGWPSVIPLAISVVIMLLTWIVLMIAWRRTSCALWSRPIFLTFPWFMSYHPVYTLYYWIRGRFKRDENYSWT